MTMIENETRTRRASCHAHGPVSAERQLPRLKFPFFVTGPARLLASFRPYRCPTCGARVQPA
jgi:hypothetical protein